MSRTRLILLAFLPLHWSDRGHGGGLMGDQLRIIAVDDDPRILKAFKATLEFAGHTVTTAGSCEDARRLVGGLRNTGNRYDLVLLDLILEDGHGASLLPDFLSLDPPPAVAVVSGHVDASTMLDLMPNCAAILPKPLSQGDLLRAVATATSKRAPQRDTLLDEFARLHSLSPMQKTLLGCAVRRMSAAATSSATELAPGTIHSYWSRISQKLGVHSQRDAVALFLDFVLQSIAK